LIDILSVFTAMDRALERRGYLLEDEHYATESFGYRSRTYRKHEKAALSLLWEARDYWFIVQGGHPWRDLAQYRGVRTTTDSPERIVDTLLSEVDAAI
jgi:hypothetical protein